jgi:hypothetical protein
LNIPNPGNWSSMECVFFALVGSLKSAAPSTLCTPASTSGAVVQPKKIQGLRPKMERSPGGWSISSKTSSLFRALQVKLDTPRSSKLYTEDTDASFESAAWRTIP